VSLRTPSPETLRPIGAELGLITGVFVVLFLWQRLLRTAPLAAVQPSVGGSPAAGAVNGGLLLCGIVAVVGAYAAVRDVDTGVTRPSAADLWWAGPATLTPPALVTLTALVGSATGVRYGSLTGTAVAADPPLGPVVLVAGLGLLIGVPSLVAVCQVVVQGSFTHVVDGDTAALLTTALTGFVAVSNTGGLTPIPDTGRLIGTVGFAGLLGVGVFVDEQIDRRPVRLVGYLPVAALGLLVVGSGLAGVDSAAAGLFAATRLATLGIAAWSYDRTGSLLVPALVYASVLLADEVVVVVFEAGAGL
jgi:hypothetical protein